MFIKKTKKKATKRVVIAKESPAPKPSLSKTRGFRLVIKTRASKITLVFVVKIERSNLNQGTYWVNYARIEEPDDSGDFQRITKYGEYFEKPWQISPGITTRIEREMLIVTEEDRQRYQENIRAMRALAAEPKVESILNKPLGNIEEFGLRLDSNTIKEKNILLCFFDIEQRPSRNCLMQLSKRTQELKAKDIVVVAVQSSQISENTLNEWIRKYNISFTVGMVEGDEDKTRFTWGVRALPCILLAVTGK